MSPTPSTAVSPPNGPSSSLSRLPSPHAAADGQKTRLVPANGSASPGPPSTWSSSAGVSPSGAGSSAPRSRGERRGSRRDSVQRGGSFPSAASRSSVSSRSAGVRTPASALLHRPPSLVSVPPSLPVSSSPFSLSFASRSPQSHFLPYRPTAPGERPAGRPVDVVLESPCIYKQQDFSVPLHAFPGSHTSSTGSKGKSGAFFGSFQGWRDVPLDGGSPRVGEAGSADVGDPGASGGAPSPQTDASAGKRRNDAASWFSRKQTLPPAPPAVPDGDDGDDLSASSRRFMSMSSLATQWQSRFSFVLATIGAAVGIGCVWRFPMYCYKFGGGVFLVPYFLMLVFLGLPLLALEMALGQVFRGGQMKVMNLISPRLRGLAAATILQALFICAYYSVFLSWALHYFLACFRSTLPWVVPPEQAALCSHFEGDEAACERAVRPSMFAGHGFDSRLPPDGTPRVEGDTGGVNLCVWVPPHLEAPAGGHCRPDIRHKAQEFFFEDVLAFDTQHPSALAVSVFLGIAFVWMQVFFSLFKGLQSLTAVTYAAVLLPLSAMFLVMVSALTLDGATLGLSHFFSVDWSVLVNQPAIWGEAAAQVFFSLGVFQGVMTAYAAHKKVVQNAVVDASAVAASNTVLSVISGVATFAIAGHVAKRIGALDAATGLADMSAMNIEGSQLVFVLYPISLATLPGAQLFCLLFFLAFFLLGVTSALSFVQPVIDTLKESRLLHRARRWKLTFAACVAGFLLSVPFCLRTGVYLLDTADYHWSVVGLTFLGCCECIAFGWVYGLGRQAQTVGFLPVALHAFSYLGGITIGAFVLFVVAPANRVAVGLGIALPLMLLGAGLALCLCPRYPPRPQPPQSGSADSLSTAEPSLQAALRSLQAASRFSPLSLAVSTAAGGNGKGALEDIREGEEAQLDREFGSIISLSTLSADNPTEEDERISAGKTRAGVGAAGCPFPAAEAAQNLPPFELGAAELCAPSAVLSLRDRAFWLYLGNVEHLRLNLNAITAANARVLCLWPVWSVVIKYLSPAVLLLLLFHELGQGPFFTVGGFPLRYQAAAVAVLALIFFLVFLGLCLPQFWSGLVPHELVRETKAAALEREKHFTRLSPYFATPPGAGRGPPGLRCI
ncbi:Sodium:neurotransmitter symporter family protein [Besnoitia besnoiti]|uniref:Sodium:neurotransmitter symporter family protein n=1 Tax=Besnoitia besnoiti TaxID=94643 RepID=A0A2A9MDP8_BESBE|nr:Sodium:neurotransmitter symporter family protein [Besnoitia besnoiti]PFH36628.1 Sodium:neurotransmitter symporter family protein [Besnoitia besnoiti]